MSELIRKLDLACRLLYGQKKRYLAEYLECNKRSLENIEAGKPYVLCTYYFPSELAAMYDAEFIFIERIVGIAVSCGLIEGRRNNVLPSTICSYHTAFWELIERGILPKPAMIIALSYPCVDARILCEKLHNLYHIPIVRIGAWDRKYPITKSVKESGYAAELRDCCAVLQKYFTYRQTVEETVELANQAVALKRKIDEKRTRYPGIVSCDDILKIFTVENLFGRREAINVLKFLLKYIEEKEKRYSFEKIPCFFWMGLIPLYDNSMLRDMEIKYSCRFVYEEMWMFGNYHLEASTFYHDIEKKIKGSLFYDLDERINHLIRKIMDLNVSVVINFSQARCSFLPPQIKEIEKSLCEHNIFMHHLGADVVGGHFPREKLEKILGAYRESEDK